MQLALRDAPEEFTVSERLRDDLIAKSRAFAAVERQNADQHFTGHYQQHRKQSLAKLRQHQKRKRADCRQRHDRPLALIIRRGRILNHAEQHAAEHKNHDQQQPAHKARREQRTCRLRRSQRAGQNAERTHDERIAAVFLIQPLRPIAPQDFVGFLRRALVQKTRALAHIALRKEHLKQLDLCWAAFIAHINATAQCHARVFAAEDC